MFNFNRSDLQRITVAAIGTVIVTTTAVGAAVGPAHAFEKAPVVHAAAAQAGTAHA